MKHILYDMGNFLLKEKNSFMSGQNKFMARADEGLSHNGEKNVIDVFDVSDHLEHFGRLLFFPKKIVKKNNYLDRWGVPHPPVENSAFIIFFFLPLPLNWSEYQ